MIVVLRGVISFFLLWFLARYSLIVSIVCLGILISPVFKLIDGLCSLNQGSPKIMSEDPILQMRSRSRHSRPSILVLIQVEWVIFPIRFSVPSTFRGVMGIRSL